MYQTDEKKQPRKESGAVKALQEIAKREAAKPKEPEPPPPDELPENPGISDYVRVGTSRLKRAVFGPPKPPKKEEKK